MEKKCSFQRFDEWIPEYYLTKASELPDQAIKSLSPSDLGPEEPLSIQYVSSDGYTPSLNLTRTHRRSLANNMTVETNLKDRNTLQLHLSYNDDIMTEPSSMNSEVTPNNMLSVETLGRGSKRFSPAKLINGVKETPSLEHVSLKSLTTTNTILSEDLKTATHHDHNHNHLTTGVIHKNRLKKFRNMITSYIPMESFDEMSVVDMEARLRYLREQYRFMADEVGYLNRHLSHRSLTRSTYLTPPPDTSFSTS
jgi:hypothetical protein